MYSIRACILAPHAAACLQAEYPNQPKSLLECLSQYFPCLGEVHNLGAMLLRWSQVPSHGPLSLSLTLQYSSHMAALILVLCPRDGAVFGCGSTKHGQLPFLKFSQPDGDGSSMNQMVESSTPRDEITQATCLRLPLMQVVPQLVSAFTYHSSWLCMGTLN